MHFMIPVKFTPKTYSHNTSKVSSAVDRAEALRRRRHPRVDVGGAAHVDAARDELRVGVPGVARGRLDGGQGGAEETGFVGVGERDVGAQLREARGDGEADA
ncbi:hypothetical protein UCDDS831_g04775 [Diplodia seriata]|uniref:Uncharacterized protein n=1 Tax=Diplodia seriata TaxID=420778 RepID=A0A0G2G9U1_9PEZI|nr:hypothetical protein UCDDS831_g04775 [Diplodia seriata]